MTARQIDSARRRLLAWYRRSRRDLPWRRSRDPYAIWISEIMLQQTRVETVRPYYARFLARFPTVAALAGAPVDAVLQVWTGLGYYARARNLHAAARKVAREHGGNLPRDEPALLALPGVGRYTAGAIRSIAFDERAPVLDGNVARVLTRLFVLPGDPRAPALSRHLWDLAAQFVEAGPPGDTNQALMELGALVCTPGVPDCHLCPLARTCRARAGGEVERYPELPRRRPVPEVHGVAALCVEPDAGRVLLVKRPPEGLLGGLWELPGGERTPSEEPAKALRRSVRTRLGVSIDVGGRAGAVTHVFTHRRLELGIYHGALRGEPTAPPEGWCWIGPAEVRRLPLSRLTLRALAAAAIVC